MRLLVIAAFGLFAISLAQSISISTEPTSTPVTSTTTDAGAGSSQGSSTASTDASSPKGRSESTVTGESSTSALSTPANTGSTATPGSTITGASTTAGPSTASVSPHSAGPSTSPVTQASESTTTAEPPASTSSPIPLSTTPYPVTVLKKGIDMSCSAGRCRYVLKVPVLSKGFLDTQQGLIDEDRKQLATDETKLATIEQKNNFQTLQDQFDTLKEDVDGALADLAKLQAALARMKDNNAKIKNSITDAQRIIGFFSNDQDNCLYKECLIPQSTTIITTTPEPPSSTADPCTADSCNGFATCSNKGGQATCGTCIGNLDNSLNCATSVCTPVGQSIVQDLAPDGALFLSPGWYINGTAGVAYDTTTKCEWKFRRSGKTIDIPDTTVDPPLQTMDDGAIISFDNGVSVNTANNKLKRSKLLSALNTNKDNILTITFSPGKQACSTPPCHFYLNLTLT
ncbi:unnamed protein product, partial [Mesorhabditis spiculigera]